MGVPFLLGEQHVYDVTQPLAAYSRDEGIFCVNGVCLLLTYEMDDPKGRPFSFAP